MAGPGTSGLVIVLYDANGDGVSDESERSTFTMVTGGNHGLAVTPTHVYASSPTTVYRWTYTAGQRTATGAAETVVTGIGGGGHVTRTLLIDGQNRLYVSIGSASNVDAPAGPTSPPAVRAQIRRFDLASIPAGCLSKSYKVQLTGAAGVAVGSEMTGTLPASGTTANIATAGTPDASLVTGISVVVS